MNLPKRSVAEFVGPFSLASRDAAAPSCMEKRRSRIAKIIPQSASHTDRDNASAIDMMRNLSVPFLAWVPATVLPILYGCESWSNRLFGFSSVSDRLRANAIYIKDASGSVFNTPFSIKRRNRHDFAVLAQLHRVSMNAVNTEVFDKQTASIFPSWQVGLSGRESR
jgi:hypothetical protein